MTGKSDPRLRATVSDNPFRQAVLVGCGDVSTRYLEVMKRLLGEKWIENVAYVDLKPKCPFELGAGERYTQTIDGEGLPADLYNQVGSDTIVFLAIPNGARDPYLEQLAHRGAAIGVEKPPCRDMREARWLRGIRRCYALSHYVHKESFQHLVRLVKLGAISLGTIARVEFLLLETRKMHGGLENIIMDCGFHAVETFLGLFRAGGREARVRVERASVATYASPAGDSPPGRWTAARVDGMIELWGRSIPFSFAVGKGVSRRRKQIVLTDGPGFVEHRATLEDQDPAAAHERMIRELVTQREPKLPLSLDDNVSVVKCCLRACEIAVDYGTYPFGTMPGFMDGLMETPMTDVYY